jgi:fluoride ion exporter CrcB/FEX
MKENIPPEIMYVVTASIGGVAKYMHEYIKSKKFSIQMLLANIFVSAFSGYMFASFAVFLGMEQTVAYSMGGLGGFMGVRALDFIEDFIRHKTIKRYDEEK